MALTNEQLAAILAKVSGRNTDEIQDMVDAEDADTQVAGFVNTVLKEKGRQRADNRAIELTRNLQTKANDLGLEITGKVTADEVLDKVIEHLKKPGTDSPVDVTKLTDVELAANPIYKELKTKYAGLEKDVEKRVKKAQDEATLLVQAEGKLREFGAVFPEADDLRNLALQGFRDRFKGIEVTRDNDRVSFLQNNSVLVDGNDNAYDLDGLVKKFSTGLFVFDETKKRSNPAIDPNEKGKKTAGFTHFKGTPPASMDDLKKLNQTSMTKEERAEIIQYAENGFKHS